MFHLQKFFSLVLEINQGLSFNITHSLSYLLDEKSLRKRKIRVREIQIANARDVSLIKVHGVNIFFFFMNALVN